MFHTSSIGVKSAALPGQSNTLKEYAHKDYLSFQNKGVGETTIWQQILCKSMDRFRRYDHLYIFLMSDYGSRHFVNLITLPKSKKSYLQDLV